MVYKRFNAWSIGGKWLKIFMALSQATDFEWIFIDGCYVKAHQHSTGANSNDNEAVAKNRGGLTSKIHWAVDSTGLPIHFEIFGGEVHDRTMAPTLIKSVPKNAVLIADKGYDSEALRQQLSDKCAIANIPKKQLSAWQCFFRQAPLSYDTESRMLLLA